MDLPKPMRQQCGCKQEKHNLCSICSSSHRRLLMKLSPVWLPRLAQAYEEGKENGVIFVPMFEPKRVDSTNVLLGPERIVLKGQKWGVPSG